MLTKPSIIHSIIYQQRLLNQDSGNSSKNTARASAGSPLPTLSDLSTCMQDVASLSALTTNVIRNYAIDPAQRYSKCMDSLATANIYVLDTPCLAIIPNALNGSTIAIQQSSMRCKDSITLSDSLLVTTLRDPQVQSAFHQSCCA